MLFAQMFAHVLLCSFAGAEIGVLVRTYSTTQCLLQRKASDGGEGSAIGVGKLKLSIRAPEAFSALHVCSLVLHLHPLAGGKIMGVTFVEMFLYT
jgi:hypothetical protein